ncbi:hypothetical protein PMIN01_12640 [Paraphaeosphaeria minitans]|uniref:Uncharacterized protein n=1 Tax=Paraphaeosphaeria minitans TaxID=565426 RepID=A0A9P6KJM6_9PLEO|nr:hypothetical protein PMIN01_12640 [Paraphaeosphaeria minitans]
MNRLKTLAEHLILTFDRDAWQPSSLGATEQALRPSCIGEAVPFNAMQPKMTCSSMILLRHAVTIITLSGYSTCSDQPDRNVGSNTYLGTYAQPTVLERWNGVAGFSLRTKWAKAVSAGKHLGRFCWERVPYLPIYLSICRAKAKQVGGHPSKAKWQSRTWASEEAVQRGRSSECVRVDVRWLCVGARERAPAAFGNQSDRVVVTVLSQARLVSKPAR